VIDSTFIPAPELSPEHRRAMRRLMDRHFLGVSAASFEADLADKTHALLLRFGGELVGFSTLAEVCASGHHVIVSGDTIMDPAHWQSPALPRAWVRAVRTLPRFGETWWLLLCGGFRTYRLLSTFWRRFVPHYAGEDAALLAARDRFAATWYGERFDAATGVVRVAHPTPLRPHLAGVPVERLRDPHVAHFARLNPDHAAGAELACWCSLADENLTRAGRRVLFG
jgi:hypothetical protein